MTLTASIIWLLIGMMCLALEAFGVSGVGFFFAGLAALGVGLVVETGLAGSDAYLAQFAWFFGFTALFAALLWKPLRRWHSRRGMAGVSADGGLIGARALVAGSGLEPGREGQVSWSGTLMTAELAAGITQAVPAGETVLIVEVNGAKLIVRPLK